MSAVKHGRERSNAQDWHFWIHQRTSIHQLPLHRPLGRQKREWSSTRNCPIYIKMMMSVGFNGFHSTLPGCGNPATISQNSCEWVVVPGAIHQDSMVLHDFSVWWWMPTDQSQPAKCMADPCNLILEMDGAPVIIHWLCNDFPAMLHRFHIDICSDFSTMPHRFQLKTHPIGDISHPKIFKFKTFTMEVDWTNHSKTSVQWNNHVLCQQFQIWQSLAPSNTYIPECAQIHGFSELLRDEIAAADARQRSFQTGTSASSSLNSLHSHKSCAVVVCDTDSSRPQLVRQVIHKPKICTFNGYSWIRKVRAVCKRSRAQGLLDLLLLGCGIDNK